jgi:hypothetical protein
MGFDEYEMLIQASPLFRPGTWFRSQMAAGINFIRCRTAMMSRGARLMLPFALVLLCGRVDAENLYKISGCVGETLGRSCGDTSPRVRIEPGGILILADRDGHFESPPLPPGRYREIMELQSDRP